MKIPFGSSLSPTPLASGLVVHTPHSSGFGPVEDNGMDIFRQPLGNRFFDSLRRMMEDPYQSPFSPNRGIPCIYTFFNTRLERGPHRWEIFCAE